MRQKIINLLNKVKDKLPEQDVKNITMYIEHGESGIAFEVLASQLYDHDVTITKDFYDEAIALAIEMKVESLYWSNLVDLVRDVKK